MISNVKKEWLFNKKISYLILDVKKEWVFNKKISDLFFLDMKKNEKIANLKPLITNNHRSKIISWKNPKSTCSSMWIN